MARAYSRHQVDVHPGQYNSKDGRAMHISKAIPAEPDKPHPDEMFAERKWPKPRKTKQEKLEELVENYLFIRDFRKRMRWKPAFMCKKVREYLEGKGNTPTAHPKR